ncbi:MAG: YifB family Mg chelatase-like AAA ATPase [Propionibacteriaceae bacterium]|jgi:magnesium chelatase family protein|nr:YifB family Mg chelatase-like AAA ATPase [Propionibacteriaceae bacterium]
MSIGSAWSIALTGLEGTLIEVEASITAGLPRTVLVGLPDSSLMEAKERCRDALYGAGFGWPGEHLTINLTPASMPKAGSHYDLAIVAAVLAAGGKIPREVASTCVLMGELGLDGRVHPVRGVLPGVVAAVTAGRPKVVVPSGQVGEASLVEDAQVFGVSCLDDLIEVLNGRLVLNAAPVAACRDGDDPATSALPDMADVLGHPDARWAMEVAAAGRHHVFLHGAPGAGKTMLAERLPGLLPPLSTPEALEVSAIHSLAGEQISGLIRRPPFSSPHHNATVASMIGGGARLARPGQISLAHRGVLFLDEAPQFSVSALDALRTPLESGWVSIARVMGTVRYPARFQLVLAANPCPCGMNATAGAACRCFPATVRRYNERLSGPILDRIDIHHQIAPIRASLIRAMKDAPESSTTIAARVAEARARALARLAPGGFCCNAEVPGAWMRRELPEPDGGLKILDDAVQRGRISSRGVDKALRLAWTLADLSAVDRPTREHLAAALTLNQTEWMKTA